MNHIRSGYQRLIASLGLLAGIVFAVDAVLITVDVVIRNVWYWNIAWLPDFVEFSLYFGAFMAAPWVLSQNAHVRIDIALTALAPKAAMQLERLVNVLGAAVSLLFGYYGLHATIDAYRLHSIQYKTFAIPEWCLLVFIPFAMLLLGVEFLRRLFRALPETGADSVREGF